MENSYDHHQFEAKWRERWESDSCFRWRNDGTKPKYYVLEMFPYTSGKLHMGHVRNYTMGDIIARLQRARGFDVLYPTGWDAFGLPAENAAIARKIHPRKFTGDAIVSMKTAMQRLGLSYDWSCEVNTSEPEYTRAQQLMFVEFFKKNLVYRASSFVNWCESCQTVLANEQASGGTCWRCEGHVNKRRVSQWFMNIRSYADELLESLDQLPGWPDSVKNIQRAWIGRSEGAEILFQVEGVSAPLKVFTTRPDTLFGSTFVALAPEHDLIDRMQLPSSKKAAVGAFRSETLLQAVKDRAQQEEKRGVFTGCYTINPINGDRVPIWIVNYVMMDYGTGAIMAVPAHDQRDFEFAKQYDIPIRTVILKEGSDPNAQLAEAYTGDGVLVNSGSFDGTPNREAIAAITAALAEKQRGKATREYRLQNWSISRQRYWGNPIPMIQCDACGPVPVPEDQLPVLLPEEVEFTGRGSPLGQIPSYIQTTCPTCGGPAERDPDTMDTFMDSSWYFLRYTASRCESPFDRAVVNRMLPVDVYIGGLEHATLHLLYSRFIIKVLRDLGMLDFDEPFARLYNQGMVNDTEGRKQSKSAGNVVEPSRVTDKYGTDALRLYMMFATAHNAPLNWNDDGPRESRTYLNRLWRLQDRLREPLSEHNATMPSVEFCPGKAEKELRKTVHETIRKVTDDVERLQFNTAVAALMTLTNAIYVYPEDAHAQPVAAAYRVLIRLAGPFVPYICEEIWSNIGDGSLLVARPWPEFDPTALIVATKEIAVQLNGKFILTIEVADAATEKEVLEHALAQPRVDRRIDGRAVKKVVHVPGRLVNVIVA
ncbi:MAG: leucine--tRNA ligase [Planctomycetes bacterium]|nr:leucine--tRNA ligase [Planctomycetota bacterium]